jgi:hypothetical protein
MERAPIVFVGSSDLSGHFRGKSFPAVGRDLAEHARQFNVEQIQAVEHLDENEICRRYAEVY